MRIQHNISALNTYRQMATNNTGSAKALEKLSSGYKINRAGDDAAGLAISEKMRAQINGLNRASANAQDGVSLIQAAEGALQETHSILQRMRELSVQAANDVNEVEDRKAIQDELNQLTKEVDRIAFTTEFNKKTILDGSLENGKYIRSVSGFNVSSIALTPLDTSTLDYIDGLTTIAVTDAGEHYKKSFDFALDIAGNTTDIKNGVVQASGKGTLEIELTEDIGIAAGLDVSGGQPKYTIAINEGDTGATIAGKVRDILSEALGADFNVTASGTQVTVESKFVGKYTDAFVFTPPTVINPANAGASGLDEEGSDGRDVTVEVNGGAAQFFNTDFIVWSEDDPSSQTSGILRGRDTIKQLQLFDGSTPTEHNQFSFKIDDATKLSTAVIRTAQGNDMTLQVGANTGYDQTIQLSVKSLSAKSLGISALDVSNHALSQNALAAVEGAIQIVSDQRAGLGSVQNRLEHTVANLDTVAENLQSAESRVRDVDMAKEMMNFTKYNILMQASQAMMAQANSQPQGVLQLLR